MQLGLFPGNARPFLKWAGGKRQLVETIDKRLPEGLKNGRLQKYFEPFVGGGAVFFHLAQNYPINEIYLSDANPELILTYVAIKRDVLSLINTLADLEEHYLALDDGSRKEFYYETRARFNEKLEDLNFSDFSPDWVERAALTVFLNRTCFNGLFRVNSRGEFNVPHGRYRNPRICDADNLAAVSHILQNAHIGLGDFTIWGDYVDDLSFVYFDPPYRPISSSSNFTSYSKNNFDDKEQLRLADFYRQLDKEGALLMLSNSDPKNENHVDEFFDQAYAGFRIERVKATRNINSRTDRRGEINELLIMNYT